MKKYHNQWYITQSDIIISQDWCMIKTKQQKNITEPRKNMAVVKTQHHVY